MMANAFPNWTNKEILALEQEDLQWAVAGIIMGASRYAKGIMMPKELGSERYVLCPDYTASLDAAMTAADRVATEYRSKDGSFELRLVVNENAVKVVAECTFGGDNHRHSCTLFGESVRATAVCLVLLMAVQRMRR